MQLMTEPHNRRQHLLDTSAFYPSNSNYQQQQQHQILTQPETEGTIVEGARPPSESSEVANIGIQEQQQQQHQQDLATRVGNLTVYGIQPTTSEITNQTEAIGISEETTSSLASESVIRSNIPSSSPFDDESSRASTISYQGGGSTFLTGVKSELSLESNKITSNNNNSNSNSNSSTINSQSSNNTIAVDSAQYCYPRMNIQPSGFTKNHLLNNGSLSATDELSIKKRREDLSRRPSYRKIFNDLTGLSGPLDTPPTSNAHMINVGQLAPPTAPPQRQSPQQHVTSSNQIQAANTSPSPQALDLLSSVGMTAAAASGLQDPSLGASQSPISVVDLQTTSAANQLSQQQLQQIPLQHQQQQHHQHHHLPPPPIPQATNHQHQQQHARHHHHQPQQQQQQHHHQHPHQHQQSPQHQHQHLHQQQQQQQQLPPPHHHPQASQSHQAHLMLNTTTSPPITGKAGVGEEGGGGGVNKKRELRLQKNREAAKECRRKKKEYIKCLENRVAVLENQNKALIDELKTLKDLYCKSTNE